MSHEEATPIPPISPSPQKTSPSLPPHNAEDHLRRTPSPTIPTRTAHNILGGGPACPAGYPSRTTGWRGCLAAYDDGPFLGCLVTNCPHVRSLRMTKTKNRVYFLPTSSHFSPVPFTAPLTPVLDVSSTHAMVAYADAETCWTLLPSTEYRLDQGPTGSGGCDQG